MRILNARLSKFLIRTFFNSYFSRRKLIQLISASFIAAITTCSVNAQNDTTGFKKYIVKKKSRHSNTGSIITPSIVPPGDGGGGRDCSLTGNNTAVGGSTGYYILSCSDGAWADYWQVSCGTPLDIFGDEIVVQWNSSGCSSGTIRAYKNGGILLATKTVSITAPQPSTISYTPLYTSATFTKTVDLSKPVGTVAGAAGTTPSGGVTYSIPIYTPPGTNGMEPSISVGYNSQAASGVAGWGWNISGLSVISRTGKNIYHNGIVKPVTYTTEDAFLLDGMRLNAITGSNGANGTVYAAEAESFAKITSITTGSANNPASFKVIAKDGSIMEFGNTTDSRVLTDNGLNVLLWRLNKILDISGNYIDFVYDNTGRDSRIKIIKYTGNINTGMLPNNVLAFNYKLRADKNTGYDAGASLSSQYLLDKITVMADDDILSKTYQFSYGFDNVSSFLKEVIESAGNGTSLNSTIFLYGDQPQNILSNGTVALTGPYDFFSGDYDADGKSDLLAAKSYYDATAKARLHYEYSLLAGIHQTGSTLLYTKTVPQNTSSEILTDKKLFNFLNSDFNGDGRDDVMQININSENLGCSPGATQKMLHTTINYTKSHNTQTGFTNYQEAIFPSPTDGIYQYQYIHNKGNFCVPGDFDGDGNRDFIMILAKKTQGSFCAGSTIFHNYSFSYKAFLTSPSTGEIDKEIANFGFGPNPTPDFYAETIAGADMINALDFDGDGKMEILVTKDATSYILSIQRVSIATGYSFGASVIYTTPAIVKDNRVFPGDFNGDGKTDLLVRNNDGSWKILYSNGIAFSAVSFTFNQWVSFTGNYGDHLLQVSDFNGDGKSDILHGFPIWVNGTSSSSNFSLYYSKGQLSATPFYYEQYTYNNILASGRYGSSEGIVLGDFNGDGRTDMLNRYNVNSSADFISFKAFGKERLLAKVTDGHNTTTSFNYKLLTDKSTYPYFYDRTVSLDDPANQNPYNYVQLPWYAVASITVPDGIGGNNITSFSYENAVVHRAAKGFLGFKKITTKNDVGNIASITENEVNTQFAIPYTIKQTTKLTSTSELLSESRMTNSFVNLSTGFADKRYLQKIDKTLNIDYLTGRAAETVNTYDSYGNVTQSISKTGILSGSTVTASETATTTAAYSIHNTPVPAMADNVTVTNTRTGMPSQSSTTTFTYTGSGLLASQKVFNGLPKAVTTSYTHNSYGNVLTAVTSSAGLNSSTVTNTYDTRGSFVLNKQISSGGISQTESYSYDYQWGKPLMHTSTDCLTTSFEYDIFGRLKKTTYPRGNTVSNSLVWDISGNSVWYAFNDYSGGNADTKTWYDKLNRGIKTQTAGFNSQWLTRATNYNAKGQVSTQTNDYYATETPLTTTNTYDVYGRLISAANTLNTVTNAYTALSNGRVQVVTANASGQSATKISDATGKVITAIDNGGQLDFTYDSRGNQTQVTHGSNILVASIYDSYGRQTSLTDKNAGTVTYAYNAFGQLTQQTDAKNNTYNMAYDGLGRITSRTGAEGTTAYEYYFNGACSNNSFSKIIGFNGVVKEYTYDTYKRPVTEKVTIDGVPYITSFTYNQYNALIKTVYPSGIEENKTYDINGGMLTVTGGNAGSPVTLFTATAANGFGQYTGFTMGNGKATQNNYYFGTPVRYYTAGVQDLNLTFDYTRGNLLTRRDAVKNITESFTFDNLNRLTSNTVNGIRQVAISYDGTATSSTGNIATKADAGNYVYKSDKIHAVAYITNPAGTQVPPSAISTVEQQISYTPYLKTATITEAPYSLEFTYGPDYQRVKTLLKNNSVLQETRLYLGNFEKQIIAGGATREIHYVSGGTGLCAILVKEGGILTPYYIYTDHLGSLLTVTNAAGAVVAEQNFDAWGRKRTPGNWQYAAAVPATPAWLYRGYTSHEHLPNFTLINMNGRMYDPVQGRMLSPDNYVSTPFGTQGYNRYGYALNNPLTITDPDGEFIHIIIGAAIGGFVNLGIKAYQGRIGSFSDGLKAFGVGAVAGGLGAATGGATLAATGLAGASVAGGALAGVAGSIVSSPILGVGNNVFFGDPYSAKSFGRDVLIGGIGGAVVGGAIAAFKGNNIWLGNPVANGRSIWSFNNAPTGSRIVVDATKYAGWENLDGSFTDKFAGHRIGETEFGGFAAKGGVAAIEAGEYTITKTVANNLATRPYINSPSTIKNIMSTGKGVPDAFFKGGVNYKVPGTFQGSKGIFELGINPQTNTIYHFLFKH